MTDHPTATPLARGIAKRLLTDWDLHEAVNGHLSRYVGTAPAAMNHVVDRLDELLQRERERGSASVSLSAVEDLAEELQAIIREDYRRELSEEEAERWLEAGP